MPPHPRPNARCRCRSPHCRASTSTSATRPRPCRRRGAPRRRRRDAAQPQPRSRARWPRPLRRAIWRCLRRCWCRPRSPDCRSSPRSLWPLPIPSGPPWQQPVARVEPRDETPRQPRDAGAAGRIGGHRRSDHRRRQPQPTQRSTRRPCSMPSDTGAWCEALTRALRAALAARVVPQALLAAAEQWQRGRCVVLACPQGDDPAGPGVGLRAVAAADSARRSSRAGAARAARRGPPAVARAAARPRQWCHVRVIKEHHPRHGRQLVSLATSTARRRRAALRGAARPGARAVAALVRGARAHPGGAALLGRARRAMERARRRQRPAAAGHAGLVHGGLAMLNASHSPRRRSAPAPQRAPAAATADARAARWPLWAMRWR